MAPLPTGTRKQSWAIRVKLDDGRMAFIRQGGKIGNGPIATFYSKDDADRLASIYRDIALEVTVIERSHGRRA